MVNRSTRNPGALARFDASGQISTDVPSYAVNTGQASAALADVAGSLAGTLGKLADRAAKREGEMAGLSAGQQAGAAYLQSQQIGIEAGAVAGTGPWIEQAKAILRREEGFSDKTYYDVNAHRAGYGSDTTVTADGKVVKISQGMKVSREDAERDLDYRLTKREGLQVQKQLGETWATLPDGAKAVLSSVGYNYGSLPKNVVAAAKTGDLSALAAAVGGLSANKGRRAREAALILASARGATSPAPAGEPDGLVEKGNIDLAKRPQVENPDGSISTVRSMSFEEDGREVLVPTVSPDGKILSDEDAISLYRRTGQHLGKFSSAAQATSYAESLHNAQAAFYGVDQRKTGSVKAPAVAAAQPLSTAPLALRRDGTIRGEAYDDAALASWGWRMQEGVSNDLLAAQQEFQDDPAGFAGAAAQIRQRYVQDLGDPQAKEMFERSFVDRSQAYARNVAANHEKKLREEQVASFGAGLDARQVDIERQAQLLGANPDGDKIIGDQVRTVQASIDGAVAAGTITALQGEKQKQELAETAARGRIQGVYDALATPEAKEQFSLSILEDWKDQKGPLAAMPFAKVKAISDTLRRDAREQINAKSADNKVEAARLSSLIDDDVTSMTATGKGVDPSSTGLTPDHVRAVVGEAGLIKWQEAREHAGKVYDATSGMETQSADDIAQRLEVIAPKAGSAGYAEDLDVFEKAQKQASAVLKARSQDPAAAVDKAFPNVKALADQVDPQDPSTTQALVSGRLQAQKALGISDFEQQPLTNAEALQLARSVTSQRDPGLASKAMLDLVGQVDNTYGPQADRVLSQVLAAQGVDKEMATLGAGYFRRLSQGQKPTNADKRQAQVASETAASEGRGKSFTATGPSGDPLQASQSPARASTSSDFYGVPNYQQMQRLVDHPELAPAFDEKFGPGASTRIIGRPGNLSYQTPQGLVTIAPDGTQTIEPQPGQK
ncbi:hypothetical protein ACIQUB_07270 [Rhizobium sp. NPDC090275]|uniref:hypothetical protein n=1 Tax=Rhizobium sp. NPDC090275 TaxID=3364498 RepID=UPI00383AD555